MAVKLTLKAKFYGATEPPINEFALVSNNNHMSISCRLAVIDTI